jgi:hypothetical protein
MSSRLLGYIPVGQHVADVDLASVKMDSRDQSVFVPTNVQHDKVSNLVRCWESTSQGLKTRKVVPLHDFEPSQC